MISGPQSAAARALLGWTLDDLQAKTGLTKNTLGDFENARRPSTADTIQKITLAFEQEGIEFTRTGVQTGTPVYQIMGDDWYLRVLDDVIASGAKEVLLENADDKKTSEITLNKLRDVVGTGVSFRIFCEEGNRTLLMDPACYRWIPTTHFKNWLVMTYGNRVIVEIAGQAGCTVIRDDDLAETMRARFNLVWSLLPKLNIMSTSNVRL